MPAVASDNGVAEKSLTPEADARTVQQPPPWQGPFTYDAGLGAQVLYLATQADEIEQWGRNVKLRDKQLRELIPVEPLFVSALASVCARNAAFPWVIEGPEGQTSRAQQLLKTANFGKGWQDFILRLSLDLYTQDSGAFIEIIRAEDKPDAEVIGIANLDAARCYHTGLSEAPVLYLDRQNRYHYLRWYQVATVTEMPATYEGIPGIQYCTFSRLLRAVRTNRDIEIYMSEKVGGRNMRAITAIKGISATQVMEAWNGAQMMNASAGLMRYSNPLLVSSVDPTVDVGFETFDIASIPDGFDYDTHMKWYIAAIALAFLSDYQEFAPLPGGGLGTASQSETQHKKTQGKGPALFREQVSHVMNWIVLPEAVEFLYQDQDLDQEAAEDSNRKQRADERKIRIDSGELTPQVARMIAFERGDLSQEQYDELIKQDEEEAAREDEEAVASPGVNDRLDDDGQPGAQDSLNDTTMDDDSQKALTGRAGPESRYKVEDMVERIINESFSDLFDELSARTDLIPEETGAL